MALLAFGSLCRANFPLHLLCKLEIHVERPVPEPSTTCVLLRYRCLMNSKPLVLAQFVCGYWGPNLLRNFSALPNCSVKYVADGSAERRAFVQSNFPKTRAVNSPAEVLNDSEVNAVIIATPAG